jgi:hypothetical protein
LARWGLLAACLDVDAFSHAENLLRSPPGGFAVKGDSARQSWIAARGVATGMACRQSAPSTWLIAA